MENFSLMRHDQLHDQILESGNVQGWHPHPVIRWLMFLIPLIYLLGVLYSVWKRLIFTRHQTWVNTQGSDRAVQILGYLYIIFVFVIGLLAAIKDAWSTR